MESVSGVPGPSGGNPHAGDLTCIGIVQGAGQVDLATLLRQYPEESFAYLAPVDGSPAVGPPLVGSFVSGGGQGVEHLFGDPVRFSWAHRLVDDLDEELALALGCEEQAGEDITGGVADRVVTDGGPAVAAVAGRDDAVGNNVVAVAENVVGVFADGVAGVEGGLVAGGAHGVLLEVNRPWPRVGRCYGV